MLTKLISNLTRVFFIIICSVQITYGQGRPVTGTVTDATGAPAAGVTITIKGTKNATQTGSNGTYSILASPDATLVFSGIGFESKEMKATDDKTDIVMANSSSNLNEVVVVGYGTVRKKDLTGSVASIQAKDFNRGQINSPEQLLQGKVPGLQITNSSGQPGGATIVKIRGNNSIRAGNSPLYVVDGVPLDGRSPRPDFNASGVGQTPGGDPLTFINPSEIASIDVLKDASAAAIYGSRGANGVILITTKKGGTGPAKLEAAASVGFSNVMRRVDVLDAAGYRAALAKYSAPLSDSGANIDPFESIIRKSVTQNYSLALSGGGENGKYRASFFAGDQDGIILKTNEKIRW